MEVFLDDLERLLMALSKKTGQPLDWHGFREMAEVVGGSISQRYLYETLFRRLQKDRAKGVVNANLHVYKLDVVAKYLGFENFKEFVRLGNVVMDPVLASSAGTYRCYLRRNTEQGVVLCSPVLMRMSGAVMEWLLRGPDQTYRGVVELRSQCLFVLMRAENGKEFHHVYRIGKRLKPAVMQGIFSGVSTGFEPIGGRVVLVRVDGEFEDVRNEALDIEVMKRSGKVEYARVARYLEAYEQNNLRIGPTMTFTLDDLG